MATDNIQIEILDDGTMKILTDKISQPNHQSAAKLINEIVEAAGGDSNFQKRSSDKKHKVEHHHKHEL